MRKSFIGLALACMTAMPAEIPTIYERVRQEARTAPARSSFAYRLQIHPWLAREQAIVAEAFERARRFYTPFGIDLVLSETGRPIAILPVEAYLSELTGLKAPDEPLPRGEQSGMDQVLAFHAMVKRWYVKAFEEVSGGSGLSGTGYGITRGLGAPGNSAIVPFMLDTLLQESARWDTNRRAILVNYDLIPKSMLQRECGGTAEEAMTMFLAYIFAHETGHRGALLDVDPRTMPWMPLEGTNLMQDVPGCLSGPRELSLTPFQVRLMRSASEEGTYLKEQIDYKASPGYLRRVILTVAPNYPWD